MITGLSVAQDITYHAQGTPTEMIIDGDSNIHDWDAEATNIDATLTFQNIESVTAETLTPETFKSLSITIPVDGIKAESGGLTKNIHKYLKGKDNPNITFKLSSVSNITQQNDSLLIDANGVINAAGKDNPVEMQVTANIGSDGTINFSGEQQLLMTDFDIDPPTAVFGTIRSKDEIVIKFDVSFSK